MGTPWTCPVSPTPVIPEDMGWAPGSPPPPRGVPGAKVQSSKISLPWERVKAPFSLRLLDPKPWECATVCKNSTGKSLCAARSSAEQRACAHADACAGVILECLHATLYMGSGKRGARECANG